MHGGDPPSPHTGEETPQSGRDGIMHAWGRPPPTPLVSSAQERPPVRPAGGASQACNPQCMGMTPPPPTHTPGSIQLVGVEEGDTMPVGDSDHVVLAPSHGVGGARRVVEPVVVVHRVVEGSAGDEAGRPQSGMQNVRGGRRSIPPADKKQNVWGIHTPVFSSSCRTFQISPPDTCLRYPSLRPASALYQRPA